MALPNDVAGTCTLGVQANAGTGTEWMNLAVTGGEVPGVAEAAAGSPMWFFIDVASVYLPLTTSFSSPVHAVSFASSANTVTITLDQGSFLSGNSALPSQWTLTSPTGSPVSVVSVVIASTIITLTTTEMTTGATYTITVPSGITSVVAGTLYTSPATGAITGVGTAPTIVSAQAIDSRTLEVVFSEPVVASDALDSSKYTVSGGITVSRVSQLSAYSFRLKTSALVPGTSYSVTATGIRDLVGNPT